VCYQSLTGHMQLFLSSNKLKRIPGEICNLKNLLALSLRNNRLVELPAAVGKLRRLTELNVANNYLHHLPYEILELVLDKSKLVCLNIHPNPFYVPIYPEAKNAVEPDSHLTKDPDILPAIPRSAIPVKDTRVWNQRWIVEYKCRSQVRFFDKAGALVKGPAFPRDDSLFTSRSQVRVFYGDLEIPKAPPGDTAEPPTLSPLVNGREISRVPSLLEIAVKAWSKAPPLPDFDYWCEEAPEGLPRLLGDAKILREMEAGDRKCTICYRAFVIPRTEWIEWWEIAWKEPTGAPSPFQILENARDLMERVVPLMRRGCSWKCVPEAVPVHSGEDSEQEKARESMGS
jgi:Leucine-rich repeat (LRR) protein